MKFVIFLILCLGAFKVYCDMNKIHWNLMGPFVEWVGTVLVISFYVVSSFANHKYDSVELVQTNPASKITP